jgi:hypothetical protein
VAVYVVEVDWRHDLDDDLGPSGKPGVLDVAEVSRRARVRLDTVSLRAPQRRAPH